VALNTIKQKLKTSIFVILQRKGWKTVRLFVSSTFKDMTNERDYLVKKVFPQLRQWCEERKLRLIKIHTKIMYFIRDFSSLPQGQVIGPFRNEKYSKIKLNCLWIDPIRDQTRDLPHSRQAR
jgi:hypothetical protein